MRRLRTLGWGLVDQAASSTTSLLLVVLGAHLLGPSRLGEIVLGFACYLMLLGWSRALISQPLIVSSSAPGHPEVRTVTRSSVTMTIALGAVGGCLMAALGGVLRGSIGHGLVLFAPWMVWALVQDCWRSILFRDRRGRAAAINDAVWLAAMMLAVAITWPLESEWALVGSWGFGALTSSMLGFGQTGVIPMTLRRAWTSWHGDGWNLGRWLVAEEIAYSGGTQAVPFVIAGFLGTGATGGLRAVQTVFGPLTVLAPAVSLPMLPTLVRRLHSSTARARTLALQISIFLSGATVAYLAAISVVGRRTLLGFAFGDPFERYIGLVLPVALTQIMEAGSQGFRLLLKAAGRGPTIVFVQVFTGLITLGLVTVSASGGSLTDVAWSVAIARFAATGCLVTLALLPAPRASDGSRTD